MTSELKVGYVYHVQSFEKIYPPKGKFGICICASQKYFFAINTANRQHYDCIKIHVSEHPELQQDRYVSCRAPLIPEKGATFQERYKVSKPFIQRLIQKVDESKLLTKKVKNEILPELRSLI